MILTSYQVFDLIGYYLPYYFSILVTFNYLITRVLLRYFSDAEAKKRYKLELTSTNDVFVNVLFAIEYTTKHSQTYMIYLAKTNTISS